MYRDPIETQKFRLAPVWRRCAIYGIIGVLLVIAAEWWLSLVVLNRNPGFGFIWAPFAVFGIILLGWRLRVDEEGIGRRRIFRWELWPWRAFEQGLIHKGKGHFTYRWSDKPWWERELTFLYLKEADRDYIWKLSQQHWKAPPLPQLPENLSIGFFGLHFRRIARFGQEGLWFGPKDQPKFYEWSEVRKLLIVRLERDRQDFRKLELTLPDQTLTLQLRKGNYGYYPNWSGAPASVIVRMLQHFVTLDATETYALIGSPTSLAEAAYRLDEFKRRTSGFQQARGIIRILIVGTLIAFGLGFLKLVPGLYLLGFLGLILLVFRRTRKLYAKQQNELEAQVARFGPVGTPCTSQGAIIQ